MRKIILSAALLLCCAQLFPVQRQDIALESWKFLNQEAEGAYAVGFDDSQWSSVTVPHDWAICNPFDSEADRQKVAILQNGERVPSEKTGRTGSLPHIGIGWYRTTFTLDQTQASGRVLLTFDGAMSDASVWVNGVKAGSWPYGYTTFWFDVTSLVRSGANSVAVRLENKPQSSRWYPGAGLYRPVTVTVTDPVSIDKWGVTVTTPQVNGSWAKVNVALKFNAVSKDMRVVNTVIAPDGTRAAVLSQDDVRVYGLEHRLEMVVDAPRLWSPEDPQLYVLRTEVYSGGRLCDSVDTRFGIRTISFTEEGGFQLNGKTRKIKGVCLHHDLGPLGTAVNAAALRRQVRILKDMGCDAIRTAHNIPSPMQLDIYDEMGIMVMAESFDEWSSAKCMNGYHRFFNDWWERDLTNLIRCNRNHPSIILWSTGNEVPDQGSKNGQKISRRMADLCHREDPTRPITNGMDRVDVAITNQFAATIDVPGLNYRTMKYELAYESLPQGFVLGSETASTVSSRGVYKFPVEEVNGKRYDDCQCSSYDLEACSWSNIPEDDWLLQDDKGWVVGEFVWTGFDYLGEPTPYDGAGPSRSSYFGICDLAGLPKDRFYLYRSRWNTEQPTLHVLPHWNWKGREGEVTPVFVYTSYPAAELFINGVSQGVRTKDVTSRENRYRLRWNDVVYQPGEVKVVAYDAAGRKADETVVRTAGKPARLVLTPDRAVLDADGKDLCFVTVKAVDKNGNFCPLADNQLDFQVTGNGTYRAACNGDATSYEQFNLPTMKLFNGMLVAIVQSTENAGDMTFTVRSKGLKTASLNLRSE